MFIVFYFLSVFDIWVFCIYLEVKFMYVWCGRVDYVVIFLGINLMYVLFVNFFIFMSIVFFCVELIII